MFGDNNNQLAIASQPPAHYIRGCSTWFVVTQVASGLSQHIAPKIQITDSNESKAIEQTQLLKYHQHARLDVFVRLL